MAQTEAQRSWYQKNKDRISENRRVYRAENQETIRAYHRQWRLDNPDYGRAYDLKYNYGITVGQVQDMYDEQRGTCPGCMRFYGFELGKLMVDHDHETGEVRCLLCRMCNSMEGSIRTHWPTLIDPWWKIVNDNLKELKSWED